MWQGCSCGRDAHVAGMLMWQGCSCGRDAHVAGMLMWQGCSCGRDAHVAGMFEVFVTQSNELHTVTAQVSWCTAFQQTSQALHQYY